ncbi:DUF2946 family protein [Pelomonas sp. CA6]|uniref:DUF2946 family protein n=1 Tax=Pelomonas sp. CA6 TaxID=2907999 RepID=UPI001F4BE566|nr:DUF2946 family protein [Pelomonas sp. CA6]MCH7343660.1 DUF2946 family protein [Pelomonas sp. CA6]
MQALQAFKTRLAWMASAALLLAALMPALSQLLAAATGAADWTEVCTRGGARLVRLDGATPATPDLPRDLGATGLEHCPYCAIHHGAPGLPPATSAPALLQTLDFPPPARFATQPRPLFAWAAAQPRAPPARA